MFHRKKHIITRPNGDVVFTGLVPGVGGQAPSKNAAKRKSRELQDLHGHGCLRVTA